MVSQVPPQPVPSPTQVFLILNHIASHPPQYSPPHPLLHLCLRHSSPLPSNTRYRFSPFTQLQTQLGQRWLQTFWFSCLTHFLFYFSDISVWKFSDKESWKKLHNKLSYTHHPDLQPLTFCNICLSTCLTITPSFSLSSHHAILFFVSLQSKLQTLVSFTPKHSECMSATRIQYLCAILLYFW